MFVACKFDVRGCSAASARLRRVRVRIVFLETELESLWLHVIEAKLVSTYTISRTQTMTCIRVPHVLVVFSAAPLFSVALHHNKGEVRIS